MAGEPSLHERAIVVNGLTGGVGVMPTDERPEFELPAIMRRGGVTAANVTASYKDGFEGACENVVRLLEAVDAHADTGIRVARTADDIVGAKRDGGACVVVGFQNSLAIEGKLAHARVFHRLGVRVIQLTYQRRTLAADGCGEPADAGLSVFGRELVAELDRLGILIDLSHTGVRSTLEAIEASRNPVAFTHACLHAKNPLPRNKTDEEIRALARRGGVMGINAVARLLSPDGPTRGATLDEFLDQVDYVAELVGVEHVGLGLDVSEGMTEQDFERRKATFFAQFPELGGDFAFEHYYADGLQSMANMERITDGLVRRGYSDDDVLAVLGGNFLRLFGEVWG